jgi:hypothetical protein
MMPSDCNRTRGGNFGNRDFLQGLGCWHTVAKFGVDPIP